MQVINTNIASLQAQMALNSSQDSLQTSLQRLSTGLRINSAKDDAAGLAISQRMNAQITGDNQATRNANDGVSMSQTAEGALGQMGSLLQRIRQLAVQSANATNSASDRQSINAEVNQLTSELDRFATTTQFNGLNLLDGSTTASVFQVGANADQTITTTTANFRTSAYGAQQIGAVSPTSSGVYVAGASGPVSGSAVSASGNLVIRGGAASGVISVKTNESAAQIAAALNAQTQTGVKAEALTTTTMTFAATGTYTLNAFGSNTTGQQVTFNISDISSAAGLSDAVTEFNNQSSVTGITAQLNTNGTGVVLTSSEGDNITLGATSSGALAGNISAGGATMTAGASGAMTIAGNVILDSDSSYTITSSGTASLSTSILGQPLGAGGHEASSLQSVASLNVTSFQGATQAIRIVDAALDAVNGQRAEYGALQNRFSATISNLETTSENLQAADSRIEDADYASETANLTRSQILQQAGTAMLAQANSLPNNVLSLLKGG